MTEVRNGVLDPDGIVGGVDVERDFSPKKVAKKCGGQPGLEYLRPLHFLFGNYQGSTRFLVD